MNDKISNVLTRNISISEGSIEYDIEVFKFKSIETLKKGYWYYNDNIIFRINEIYNKKTIIFDYWNMDDTHFYTVRNRKMSHQNFTDFIGNIEGIQMLSGNTINIHLDDPDK